MEITRTWLDVRLIEAWQIFFGVPVAIVMAIYCKGLQKTMQNIYEIIFGEWMFPDITRMCDIFIQLLKLKRAFLCHSLNSI